MTYNTGNPIGSTDARDRADNSENMDILENSTTLNAHPDRLGVMRKTRKGMESEHNNQMKSFEMDFDRRLAGMASTRVGTFTTGATLTDMRQTLLWELSQGGDGHEYGWTGSFLPSGKVVAAGSTPASTGGVGAGAWVDRSDVTLRSEITPSLIESLRRSYAEAGFTLVSRSFEEGGTLTSSSDVLLHKASGKAYSGTVGSAAAGTDPTVVGSGFADRSTAITINVSAKQTLIDNLTLGIASQTNSKLDGVTFDASESELLLSKLYLVSASTPVTLYVSSVSVSSGNIANIGDNTNITISGDAPVETALA